MNNQLDYMWQQLMITTMILGTSTQPLKDRLYNAVASRLRRIFMVEHAKSLIPEIDQAIIDLEKKLTAGGLGTFRDAIDQMEDSQVKETIEQIIELFSKVCRAYPG